MLGIKGDLRIEALEGSPYSARYLAGVLGVRMLAGKEANRDRVSPSSWSRRGRTNLQVIRALSDGQLGRRMHMPCINWGLIEGG